MADLRDAGRFGIRVPEGAEADFPSVMERMRRLRSKVSEHDAAKRFKEMGVDLFLGDIPAMGQTCFIRGTARLTDLILLR